MSPPFEAFLADCRERCESALQHLLPGDSRFAHPGETADTLHEACAYALLGGGKRVRPVLVYAAAAAVDAATDPDALDHAACAMEMIHVYSLVHDDLPAMDDDDLRRGKPSCHKAFDEATAILVGDGLQARAFELLAATPGVDDTTRAAMVRTLAAAAGLHGMVGGQAVDVAAVDRDLDLEQLQAMHALKTGALIRAALLLGGLLAGASDAQLRSLDEYGRHIGLAFQVVDDILDVEGDPAALGKTRGKDGEANKPTYVKLMGLEGAREESRKLLEQAVQSVRPFGAAAEPLRALARYIVERSH